MTIAPNTDVQSRAITALFDTQEAAERAVDDLVGDGIPRQHITLHGGAAVAPTSVASGDDKGFWDSLKDMFMPDDDRYAYAEGLRRGGQLVSVRADEANYNRVIDILDREGSVDMDAREETWRSEGWSGYQSSSATGAAPIAATGTTASAVASKSAETATRLPPATGTDGVATSIEAGRDEVIPIYEERLQVGKRDVSHGRVRLRSYVVETPVSEQVSLRSESIQVERHPVDRAIDARDVAFQDRVIEAEERAEEAVVSKTARVTEEISLRKVADNETRTVSDSVRHTEVEVDDERDTSVTGATKPVVDPVPARKI